MRNVRLKLGLLERFPHQFEAARILGVHESMISMVINGRRSLTAEEKQRWIEKLGLDAAVFEATEATN